MAEYIKRASAMTVCERYSQHCFEQNDSHGQDIADRIFDNIVELPTADVVEVKHGEWITPTKIKSMTIAVPHCSVCGLVPCDKGLYCPNCGAKMDLKEGAVE